MSIGSERGPLIGVEKGPLWRDESGPEAAQLFRLRSRLGPAVQGRSCAGFEAPAVVAGFDDVTVVGEAVEQRGCHLCVAEDGRPFGEAEIGRDDDAGPLIERTHPPRTAGKPYGPRFGCLTVFAFAFQAA